MATVMHQNELLRRAVAWMDTRRHERPELSLPALLDEAGMRFNLGPAEAGNLERLFKDHMAQKQEN